MRSRQDCLDAIAAYSATLPRDAWVLGGGWSMSGFPGGTPTAADLDTVTGGRPAFLPNRDHHSAWVNTAALTLAGVTVRTPDPPDGRIERDYAGLPTGALHDGAMRLVADYVPAPGAAELTAALLAAQRYLHSLGITSIQDACVGEAGELGMPDAFDTYRRAAADRLLTCRVTGSLWWDRARGLHQVPDLQTRREAADGGGYFRATTVKLMLDGVCETFTAAMGTPYLDGHGHQTDHAGNLFIEPAELAEAVGLLADLGFQLHFHAIGDRAITAALDALAGLTAPQRASGRHHVAHLQFISPPDLDRFARLGVVANFQPLWACEDEQNTELTVPFVGPERDRLAVPDRRRCSGGERASRSAATGPFPAPTRCRRCTWRSTASCLPGSASRARPETTRPLLPAEAITVDAAIEAFTAGVAYVNHEEDVAGTLAPGMLADVAVLDQDLYVIPPGEIGGTSVAMTIASGQVVHGDE